jgi:hypothetical protein
MILDAFDHVYIVIAQTRQEFNLPAAIAGR